MGLSYISPGLRQLYATQPNQSILTQVTTKRPDAVNNWVTTPNKNKAWGHNLTTTYRVNDSVSLKNIAAMRYSWVNSGINDIFGVGGLRTPDPTNPATTWLLLATGQIARAPGVVVPAGTPIIYGDSSIITSIHQYSDEFQANIDTKPVTLTTGLLIYKQDMKLGYLGDVNALGMLRNGGLVAPGFQLPSTLQPGNAGGRYSLVHGWSKAAYLQAEIHILENLDLTGGIRYTRDRKKGVDNTARSNATPLNTLVVDYKRSQKTYAVGMNYKPTSDIMIYGKYSTGFISGGELGTVIYNPEKATSWEAGLKADWLQHILRTNLAVYTVKYRDLQFSSSPRVSPIFAVPLALGVTQLLLNAGDTRATGAELETTFTPTRSLLLQGNVSYLDFKFLKVLPGLLIGQDDFVAQGRPKWTVQLAGQWTSEPVFGDAHVTARVDANWRSKMYLTYALASASLGNAGLCAPVTAVACDTIYTPAESAAYKKSQTAKARWMVNTRLSLDDISLAGKTASVAVWSRNLFNDKSANYGFSGVSASPIIYEPARTYGVEVSFDF